MTPSELVGRRLRFAREHRGLSQTDLGRALADYLGKPWPKQAVSAAETGRRSITAEELFAFAAALETSIVSLIAVMYPAETLTYPTGREMRAGELMALLFRGYHEAPQEPTETAPMLAALAQSVEQTIEDTAPALGHIHRAFTELVVIAKEAQKQANRASGESALDQEE